MDQTQTTYKIIDETRQGEAFYSVDNETLDNVNLKRFYIESYGCAMNFSDSEIVASILSGCSYGPTKNIEQADLILLNTCSIREKAEDTIRQRLKTINKLKFRKPDAMVGILGCMAERLKQTCLKKKNLLTSS